METYDLPVLIENRLQSQADIQQQIESLQAEAAAFQASIEAKIGDLTIQSYQYQGQIALLQALTIKGAILYLPDSAPQPTAVADPVSGPQVVT